MEKNIYETPESTLLDDGQTGDITKMKRFSAWGVFGLYIVTFGIYPVYWLYSRAESINSFHHKKIQKPLLSAFLITVILSYLIEFAMIASIDTGSLSDLSSLVTVIYLVLYLVVLFSIRSRLIEIMGKAINPAYTFLFNAIYLQYKINEAIDEANSKQTVAS